MEEINFSENFIETDQLNSLEKETLIGWSTACLDEAISFYIDCNCTSIITEGLSELKE
jgi:hypothetical protein